MAAQQTTIALQDLTGDYQIDPTHSRLGFVARHAMVTKVRGHFNEFEGRLHLDADDPSRCSAEIRIKVASISTSQDQRDEHLRNADFFDAENHPEIVFRSTSAEAVDDDTYRLTGDLTIKGITRPVTIDLDYTGAAKDPWGNLRVGFEGRTDVNRKDWGITWNSPLETGGFLVGEKIRLELDISAVKLPADA
jgi:polyisoprenoid-binding protein YceI